MDKSEKRISYVQNKRESAWGLMLLYLAVYGNSQVERFQAEEGFFFLLFSISFMHAPLQRHR